MSLKERNGVALVELAGGEMSDEVEIFLLGRAEINAVHFEKDECSHCASAFVAINEGMVITRW